jgi:non-ribosomal peptide synthetase component F
MSTRRGVGPDTLVALCVERSLEMMVGLLGILKAGSAYVPIDPDLPPQRMAYILEEMQSPVALIQHRLRTRLP